MGKTAVAILLSGACCRGRIGDDEVAEVIRRTLEETPPDATHSGACAPWGGPQARPPRRSVASSSCAPSRPMSRSTWMSTWLDIHLVMDNDATHKTPAIRKWFARHPRWHIHFTPTDDSLASIERFRQYRNFVRRDYTSAFSGLSFTVR